MPFALFIASMRSRIGFEKRIGTSLKVSTPPAMTTSLTPVWICEMPVQIAWLAEMHAWVTVCAAVDLGMPAPSAASRAMLEFFTSWMTWPIMT